MEATNISIIDEIKNAGETATITRLFLTCFITRIMKNLRETTGDLCMEQCNLCKVQNMVEMGSRGFLLPKEMVNDGQCWMILLVYQKMLSLTDDLIADNMIDMMIPGEDSVPVLMTLAVKYLSDYPAALQQLTDENIKLKELKAQLGEPLSWSDYLSLPFTQNVITETLRMGNIIIGVMRKAMRDIEIKGYLIPKGWCFFAYFRSVHLDESNYDWPYQFNPWRWQDNKDISNSSFTPFGGGQRLCPGLDLARLEASIFLHHLVTQFRWVAEEDTVVNFPTVRMKRRMPIWVKKREDYKLT